MFRKISVVIHLILEENCSTEDVFLYLWDSLSSCESHCNTFIYLALGKPSIAPWSTFWRKSLCSCKISSFSISVNPRSFIGWMHWGKPVFLWNIMVMTNKNETGQMYNIILYYTIRDDRCVCCNDLIYDHNKLIMASIIVNSKDLRMGLC